MAGPYQIIDDTYTVGVPRWGQPPRCGPFEYGGNLYAVVGWGSEDDVALVKSTDSGATWSHVLELGFFAGNVADNPAIIFNTCKSIDFDTTGVIYIVSRIFNVEWLHDLAVAKVSLASESVEATLGGGAISILKKTYIQPFGSDDDVFIEQASDGTIGILAPVTYYGVPGSAVVNYPKRTICALVTDADLSSFSDPITLGTVGANSVGQAIVRKPNGDIRAFFFEWATGVASGSNPGTAYYSDIVVGGAIGDGSRTAISAEKVRYATHTATYTRTFGVTSTSFSDTGDVSTYEMTDPDFATPIAAPPETGAWAVGWWDGDFWNMVMSNFFDGFYYALLDGSWSTAELILSTINYYLSGDTVSSGVGLIYTPDEDLITYPAWFYLFETGGGTDCCRCLPHGDWGSGPG
jgi:hypothetical protein